MLKKKDFYVNKHQIALHIRFLPKQATEENIYNPKFLRRAEFINIDSVLQKKSEGTEDGSSLSGKRNNEPGWGNPGEGD